MPEFLTNFNFIFWTSVAVMVVVPTLAHYWYKVRQAELETELKREMIQRGMSTDQIVRVLRASSDKDAEPADERAG